MPGDEELYEDIEDTGADEGGDAGNGSDVRAKLDAILAKLTKLLAAMGGLALAIVVRQGHVTGGRCSGAGLPDADSLLLPRGVS